MARNIDWDKVDWNKRDVTLAKELGRSPSTIRIARKRGGFPRPTERTARYKRNKKKWDKVDWLNKNDAELAKEFGLSRERIRQIRKDFHYPVSVVFYLQKKPRIVGKYLEKNRKKFKKMWIQDIRKDLEGKGWKYTTGTVRRFLKANNIAWRASGWQRVKQWVPVYTDQGRRYESLTHLARELGVPTSYISMAVKGGHRVKGIRMSKKPIPGVKYSVRK